MDLRDMKFFLAIAREKSFVRAAESLHHTQPNLTRTIRELEEELGGALFVRSSKGVTLTPKGELLYKRAHEITELVERTEVELINKTDDDISGPISIAAGETVNMSHIVQCMHQFQNDYPGIEFRIHSANGEEVARRVDLGLADIGLVFEPFDLTPYLSRRLPWSEYWGIAVRGDHPLAKKTSVSPDDLSTYPLIVSAQFFKFNALQSWFGKETEHLHIAASYNLINTALQMASEGMGALMTFEGLLQGHDDLVFIPLTPKLEVSAYLIRKKSQPSSKPVQLFWDQLIEITK